MGEGNFIIDLILHPVNALGTVQKSWSLRKTAVLFVLSSVMIAVNFLVANFTGNVLGFAIYGIAFGFIMESLFLLLNLLFLYLLLRFARWSGKTGSFLKASSWLIMIPSIVYYLITLPILVILRVTLLEGFGVYLYQTAKYVMYLWIVGLMIVAVTRGRKDARVAPIAAAILAFALTYAFVLIVNYSLVSLITARVEV